MLEKLSEKVYFMKYDDDQARPSLGLVIGDKHSLMIDAGNSKAHTEEFLKEVEDLKVDNLKYVGITHFHWDHVYALPFLNLISIGSKMTQEKLNRISKSEKAEQLKVEERNTFNSLKSIFGDSNFTSLDLGFESALKLELGNTSCIFEHIGGDHADDSVLVYVEKEKIMFLGDSTYRGFSKDKRYHSLKNVKELSEKILKYDCDLYVTSHKEVYSRESMKSMLERMIELGELANGFKAESQVKINKANESLSVEDEFYLTAFLEYNNIKQN